MVQLLGVVASVAFVDSMNPSTIGPALYLASGRRGLRQVLEFTAGAMAVYFLGGLILTLGPGHLLLSLVPNPKPHTRYWIEVGVGLALAGGGIVVWWRRARLAERGAPSVRSDRRSALVLGASIMAVELPTAFPYFAAIAAIVGSGVGILRELVLLAIFNLMFTLPLLVIAVTLHFGGPRARRLLSAGRGWLELRWPQALALILGAIGTFVVMLGATGLLGSASGQFARSARHLHQLIKP